MSNVRQGACLIQYSPTMNKVSTTVYFKIGHQLNTASQEHPLYTKRVVLNMLYAQELLVRSPNSHNDDMCRCKYRMSNAYIMYYNVKTTKSTAKTILYSFLVPYIEQLRVVKL